MYEDLEINPQIKYYYVGSNRRFEIYGHYELPKDITNFPYITYEEIGVTRSQPMKKRVRLTYYHGKQKEMSKIIEMDLGDKGFAKFVNYLLESVKYMMGKEGCVKTNDFPRIKYYYFEHGGKFVSSYECPKDITNFPYIKYEVIENKPMEKKIKVIFYYGKQERTSKTIVMNNSNNASARMINAQKLTDYLKKTLTDIIKDDKEIGTRVNITKRPSNNLTEKYYNDYYNTTDKYPYKPDILTTAERNDPKFMEHYKFKELTERKKKIAKSKPKRKPVKKITKKIKSKK